MQKQNLNMISPDSPDEPEEAVNAVKADYGERSEWKAQKTHENQPDGAGDSPPEKSPPEEEALHYIEIELLNDEGNPVAEEHYKVKLPGGEIRSGRLDKQGKAQLNNIPETGNCEVSFPQIHGKELREK